jgi:hypothetical protein
VRLRQGEGPRQERRRRLVARVRVQVLLVGR